MPLCKKKLIYLLFLFTLIHAENIPKIGLVLSGGGSKGFAHIAILKALDSLEIPIDYISGTSFGAIVGAMYSLGYSGKQIEKMAIATDWYEVQKDEPERKYLPHFRKKDTGKYQLEFGLDKFTPVTPTGLIYGQKIILELSKWTREYEQVYNFDLLPIPFRCNAFDIISGKEVVLKEGSLAHALRASISIPTIFAPIEWGDALLVDGGVSNNLPVDIVKEMGADIVLSVDVTYTTKSKDNLKNIYDIIDQTISVHGYEKKIKSIETSDYYIRPIIENISFTDYRISTMQYLFDCGEQSVISNWDKFLKLKEITAGKKPITSNIKPLKKQLINQIKIEGNQSLSKYFIKSFIGLENGMQLEPEILDKSISELYSLGYFKILYYEIHSINKKNEVDVIIHLEETQLRKFYLGLRWDNLYHMIGTANIQLTSDLLPGLRIENQLQFAGIQKNEFSISYPSRRLNFPIYPFIKIINSRYPFKLYTAANNFEGAYTYSSDGIQMGLGVLLKNYWNSEFEYYWKEASIQSEINQENNTLEIDKVNAGIRILAQLDLLDDILLPNDGIFIKGTYENSIPELGSNQQYQFYQVWGKIYKTFHLNTYGISGYFHFGTDNSPRYMTTIFEGSQIFAGTKEFQLHGSSLTFFRLDYRYKHQKDVFAHFILNWLMNAQSEDNNYFAENLFGFGAGITFITPIGPLKFLWSWGPKNIYSNNTSQSLYSLSAGYNF